eukprot:TRINITY_DN6824_c0_g1_i1.p1 TRINITY_DN6824_c0_g1~~TRINITY_DN6824_c0_g1_i1.p1  ORF type:complete len:402 (+),score=171.90 TRINITY_DN6824_c0_g1_i1:82-1206(+)
MPYTLLVCADCYGEKVNLELVFPVQPTLPDLTARVEQVFNHELAVLKPPAAPVHHMRVSKLQVYDDTALSWSELTRHEQLHEYDQIYCFQPQTPWQVDVQKDLPPPRPPTSGMQAPAAIHQGSPLPPQSAAFSAPAVSQPRYAEQLASAAAITGLPQPSSAAMIAGERPNIPLEQRVALAFEELDESRRGFLTQDDLERGFRQRGIDFSTNTTQELFAKGDRNGDTRLDSQEWQCFAATYPNTVDAVYYRGRDIRAEIALRDAAAATQAQLEAGRQREAELRAQADAQAQQNQALAAQLQDQERQLREAAERRNLLENQERALIEQEVKLERQKDGLRHSMVRFKETAAAFDRDAAGHGSPRRSRAPELAIPGI